MTEPGLDAKGIEVVGLEEGIFRYRRFAGWFGYVPKVLAISLSLYVIAFLVSFFGLVGITVLDGQHNGLFLMGILVLTFLLVPPTKSARRDRVPWYDIAFIVGSLVVTGYFVLNYRSMVRTVSLLSPTAAVMAVLTFVILCEATRRTLGWAMVILAVGIGAFALTSSYMPAMLRGAPVDFMSLLGYIYISPDGVMGNITTIASTVLIAFLIFSALLQVGGGADFFIKLSMALLGRFAGGPAKVAVVASALFGTISGSPVANAGVTGAMTIKMMKQTGYKAHFAGAVSATAATGGVLMPPVMGVTAFIMADFLGVSYSTVALAAMIPAALYFLSLFIQVDREAARLGLKGLPPSEIPSLGKTLKEGWYFAIPFAVLILFMFKLNYPAEEAAIYAAASLVPISFIRKENRLTPRRILAGLQSGSEQMTTLGALMALTGVITAAFTVTGFMVAFSSRLVALSGGSILFMGLLAGVVSYLLGLGLSITVCYILLAILVAPAWELMGLPPMAAHMFLLYMGASSFITPPVAPPIYVTALIADAPFWKTGWAAMRIGVVVYLVPFYLIFRPALVFVGTPMEIALAIVLSAIGVAAVAAGLAGYVTHRIGWPERILLFGGGFFIAIPGWHWIVIGAVALAVAVLLELKAKLSPGGGGNPAVA